MTLAFIRGAAPPAVQKIGCFVVAARVKDGVADVDKLILDARTVVVTGSGRADLARDAWDLRLVPTVRDPALLSISPTVDVTGPLANPQFTPVHRTLATSAARAFVGRALQPAAALLHPLNRADEQEPVACEEPPPSISRRSLDYLRNFTGSALRFR